MAGRCERYRILVEMLGCALLSAVLRAFLTHFVRLACEGAGLLQGFGSTLLTLSRAGGPIANATLRFANNS